MPLKKKMTNVLKPNRLAKYFVRKKTFMKRAPEEWKDDIVYDPEVALPYFMTSRVKVTFVVGFT